MQMGKASLRFEECPVIINSATITGKLESEGPLGKLFDVTEQDDMFGAETWEAAESTMQKQAADLVIEKANVRKKDIRYMFAGDLLGQLIATSFGTLDLKIPLFGLYGACSTIGEALSLGAMTISGGHAEYVIAMASSHFATAEKQFRFPLGYGSQRPLCATRTVTGCGAYLLASKKDEGEAKISGITTGRMIDMGASDSMNMGAAMAPAAYDTIINNFEDFSIDENYYDQIITGDLGEVGKKVLLDFMDNHGSHIAGKYMDCGIEIYDKTQDAHAGGSGCGCSAAVLGAYILPKLKSGEWKRILFIPTGALLSTMSFNEGQSIPGIAHGVILENIMT